MGGGYSAWVDSGLAGGDKPAEELKTVCKFRPWNAYLHILFVWYLICTFRPKHSRVALAVIKMFTDLSKCERMEIKILSFQKRNACIIWQDWFPCPRERSQKFPFFLLLYVKHCSIKFAFKLSHKGSLMQRMRLISSSFLYNKHACWFVSDVF